MTKPLTLSGFSERSRGRGLLVWALALPWLGWAVVRTLGLEAGHPLTPAVAFTPYAAATGWIPVVVALHARRRIAALVAAAAFMALALAVLPRAFPGPRAEVGDGSRLTVMTANLAYGAVDADAVLAIARRERVKLLSLQELSAPMLARLDAAGARRLFPHRVLDPRPGARGTGLMARHPLREGRSPPGSRLAMPEAVLSPPAGPELMVKAVHPVAPVRGDVAVWERELSGLPPASPDGPLRLLIGDFNATLDHERLRDLLATGYVDAADAAGAGLRGTYRDGRLLPPMVAIDHVLADERIRVERVRVVALPGGDHRGVVAELVAPARGAG